MRVALVSQQGKRRALSACFVFHLCQRRGGLLGD